MSDRANRTDESLLAALAATNPLAADILLSWLNAAAEQWSVEPVTLKPPARAEDNHYDVIILGCLLEEVPEEKLVGLVNQLVSAHPAVPVVVVSDQFDRDRVFTCIGHGARGFIPSTTEPDVALAALRLVVSGGAYIPSLVVPAPAGDIVPVAPLLPAAPPEPCAKPLSGAECPEWRQLGLTHREAQVLLRLGHGQSNREIARQLSISENTAVVHVRNLMRKLGATNRTQAVLNARRALGTPAADQRDRELQR